MGMPSVETPLTLGAERWSHATSSGSQESLEGSLEGSLGVGGWLGGWMQRALGGRFSVRTLTAAFDLAPTRLYRNISSPLVTPHCLFKMTWIRTTQTCAQEQSVRGSACIVWT